MSDSRVTARFDWRLSIYGALAAFIFLLPITIYCSDITELFYVFLAAPILGLLVLLLAVFAKGRKLAILSVVLVYWAVSFVLLLNREPIRTAARWLLYSKDFKASVLAQQEPPNGELRHVEWDAWGWGGNDTTVYLVFDPDDSLAAAAKSGQPGRYNGIPCKVPRVQRLQSRWYTVQFYTDTEWGKCS